MLEKKEVEVITENDNESMYVCMEIAASESIPELHRGPQCCDELE